MITFTSPLIFGYRVFFETFNYTPTGKLLDCDRDECDTNLWLLGKFHLVISNEKLFMKLYEQEKDNEIHVYQRTECSGDTSRS